MIKFQKRVLDNGLTVIVHRDTSTPMAAVNLLYRVGSRNEDPQNTGFAHLFEHLMFGGSKNIEDFDLPIQMAGGENNAFTNNDYTNYYIALPKENLATALWAESDRMGFLNFDDNSLEVQRKVVIEEFNQRYLNQPYGDLMLLLRPLIYKVHPYQWATIGKSPEHIENATMEQVRAFHERYYTPSNAILTIAADLDEQTMFEAAEHWFAELPSLPTPQDTLPQEPEQTEGRRLVVERDVPVSLIYIAFRIGGRTSREHAVCDMITDILSNGTSSRMYQELIKEQNLFSSVNAYITGELDDGSLIVTARLLDDTTPEAAEKALWAQLTRLREEAVSDYELEKMKNKYEAQNQFSQINVLNKAINLSFFEMIGDAGMINEDVQWHNSVSAEEIQSTAQKLFTPSRANTLLYLSSNSQFAPSQNK